MRCRHTAMVRKCSARRSGPPSWPWKGRQGKDTRPTNGLNTDTQREGRTARPTNGLNTHTQRGKDGARLRPLPVSAGSSDPLQGCVLGIPLLCARLGCCTLLRPATAAATE